MTNVTIDGPNDSSRAALERRAAQHGQSIEAEAAAILQAALETSGARLAHALQAIGREYGITDELSLPRDGSPYEPTIIE